MSAALVLGLVALGAQIAVVLLPALALAWAWLRLRRRALAARREAGASNWSPEPADDPLDRDPAAGTRALEREP